MALLHADFIARFRGRILNVHPSLLPEYPGLDAVGQAIAAGEDEFGVTVHLVDEGMDTGPIVLQEAVTLPGATDASQVLEASVRSSIGCFQAVRQAASSSSSSSSP